MRREEGQEDHDSNQDEVHEPQEHVHPPTQASAAAVEQRDANHHEDKQPDAQPAVGVPRHGRDVKRRDVLAQHQRRAVREACFGHEKHQFFGQKQPLFVVHRRIRAPAEDEVDAEVHPRVAPRVAGDGTAVWLMDISLIIRQYGVAKRVFDKVIGARGAVVEHEIVVVEAVLGLVVDEQRIEHLLHLRVRQVEPLPIDLAPHALRALAEVAQRLDAELVVGVALDELEVEVLGVEGENAIIEHHVNALRLVLHEDGGVPVLRPHLRARGARQQIDVRAIAQRLGAGEQRTYT